MALKDNVAIAKGEASRRREGGDEVGRSEVRSARFARTRLADVLPVGPETMESLFAAPGWSVKQIHRDTWQGRVRTEAGYFQVLAHHGAPMALMDVERLAPELSGDLPFEQTLQLALVPYLASPEDPTRCNALYQRLLGLNHQMFGVRFAIDDDLDVLLGVECPTRTLTWSALVDARDALVHYAVAHFSALSALCLPPIPGPSPIAGVPSGDRSGPARAPQGALSLRDLRTGSDMGGDRGVPGLTEIAGEHPLHGEDEAEPAEPPGR